MNAHSPRGAEAKLPPLTAGPHTKRLGLISIVACFGGLLFGYDTGVTNGAERPMSHELGLTDLEVGVVVSALVFAAAVGAMLCGRIADRIGRRPTIIILSVLFFVGTMTVIFSPANPASLQVIDAAKGTEAWVGEFSPLGYGILVTGRILLGLAVGGASAVVPVYLAELAPFEIRGTIAGRNEWAIVFGQLAAFVVNAIIAASPLGHNAGVWRFMFAVCAIPAICLFIGMLRMPESPRWLVEQGRHGDALKVLSTIRSKDRAQAELADVEHLAAEEKSETQLGFKAVLSNKNLLKILVIASVLGIAQQFTGVNAIMYYGQRMLAEAGFPEDLIGWVNVLPGIMAVVGGTIALSMMERINRRTNFLWGLGLTAGSHIAIAIAMLTIPVPPEGSGDLTRGWVFVALVMIMILSIQTFLNIAVWVYLSEIFPLHMRGIGMGVSVFVLWVANGVLGLFVPSIVGAIGMGLFAVFAVLNIGSFGFVWKFVPETRGRTLEALEEDVTTGAIYTVSKK